MNRIEMAVKEHRAYFVLGDGFVNADVEAKLKELNVPAVSLTDETTEYIKECNAENLAGAFSGNAILVLLSPSFGESKIDQLIHVVQNGQPRPQIFLIAKSYNRFSVPMRMMRWKFNQIKQSALPFLESIPVPEIKPEESKNAKKQNQSSQKIRGPIASFVGRTEDIGKTSISLWS
jgi:hypothetical protein